MLLRLIVAIIFAAKIATAQNYFLAGINSRGSTVSRPMFFFRLYTFEPIIGITFYKRNTFGFKYAFTNIATNLPGTSGVNFPTRYTYTVFNRFYHYKYNKERKYYKYWNPYYVGEVLYSNNSFVNLARVDTLDGKKEIIALFGIGNNFKIYKQLYVTLEYKLTYNNKITIFPYYSIELHL